MPDTVTVHTGAEVAVEHVKPLENGGARFDITADDGRKWQVDITREGELSVVTTWRDGELADVDVPDWMDDIAARLRRL